MIAKSPFLFLFWSTMVVVVLVTLLAWVCWLIGGFGTDWWVWWLIGGVDLWFGQWGGGGLIVLVSGGGIWVWFWVWLCFSRFVVIGFLIWVWSGLVCLLGLWVWFAKNLMLIVLEFGEEYEEFEEPVVKWRTSWRTLRNVL